MQIEVPNIKGVKLVARYRFAGPAERSIRLIDGNRSYIFRLWHNSNHVIWTHRQIITLAGHLWRVDQID